MIAGRDGVKATYFGPHDWVPNNPSLPVLSYAKALVQAAGDELAVAFEECFRAHGWPPQWRDGIYDFHHYHSTAHEVLGCFLGSATLMLGGPNGKTFTLEPGDALLLPAGTGHRCIDATDDFQVVGAYPQGQQWDICKEAPTAVMLARIATLGFPDRDPVVGTAWP